MALFVSLIFVWKKQFLTIGASSGNAFLKPDMDIDMMKQRLAARDNREA